jgi:hypothetical protein
VLVISNFNEEISNYNVHEAVVNDETSIVKVHKSVVEVHKTGFEIDEAGGKEKISRKGLLQMKRLHSNVRPWRDGCCERILWEGRDVGAKEASHERSPHHTRT